MLSRRLTTPYMLTLEQARRLWTKVDNTRPRDCGSLVVDPTKAYLRNPTKTKPAPGTPAYNAMEKLKALKNPGEYGLTNEAVKALLDHFAGKDWVKIKPQGEDY